MLGCDIHSADRIVSEWQDVAVGDEVRLAPEIGLVVALLERGRALVLRGGIPIGNIAPPYDTTWAFVLRAAPDETTRLLVRERYAYTRPWARLIIEPTEALSFVMSQKMLRGIKDRAELTCPPRDLSPKRTDPKHARNKAAANPQPVCARTPMGAPRTRPTLVL
jgi:hypothetical protein